MVNLLIKLLPAQAKAGIKLATLLTQNLDTAEERKEALSRAMAIVSDGRVTPPEWASLGKILFWRDKTPKRKYEFRTRIPKKQ